MHIDHWMPQKHISKFEVCFTKIKEIIMKLEHHVTVFQMGDFNFLTSNGPRPNALKNDPVKTSAAAVLFQLHQYPILGAIHAQTN